MAKSTLVDDPELKLMSELVDILTDAQDEDDLGEVDLDRVLMYVVERFAPNLVDSPSGVDFPTLDDEDDLLG